MSIVDTSEKERNKERYGKLKNKQVPIKAKVNSSGSSNKDEKWMFHWERRHGGYYIRRNLRGYLSKMSDDCIVNFCISLN